MFFGNKLVLFDTYFDMFQIIEKISFKNTSFPKKQFSATLRQFLKITLYLTNYCIQDTF